jgi:hypothetical protein
MPNETAKADLADLLDTVQDQIRSLATAHQQRALLTATATACEKRIHVTVNADGVLIETRFADDIADLTYDEIAQAMTEAVRAAAAQVKTKGEQLFEPLQQARTRLPSLSEMVPGVPDLREILPTPEQAPTCAPSSAERRMALQAMEFGDAEPANPRGRSTIADDSW